MTRDELIARLQSIEWNDIEFKEAAWAVPKDALSTVSAFANTEGGHLVFGVKQTNGTFTITGVTNPTSPSQRYVLTDVGVKVKLLHEQQQATGRPGPTAGNP